MAERADGSIVVDVDLDAEGFKAGSAELQRAVKSFSAQAEKIGPAFQKAMDNALFHIHSAGKPLPHIPAQSCPIPIVRFSYLLQIF